MTLNPNTFSRTLHITQENDDTGNSLVRENSNKITRRVSRHSNEFKGFLDLKKIVGDKIRSIQKRFRLVAEIRFRSVRYYTYTLYIIV